jgi:hypothetical protein
MHHKYMSIIIQRDATMHSLFMSVNSSTCFGWYPHPSSGAHVTVSTPSEREWTGTAFAVSVHSRSRQLAVTVLQVPDDVDTVT